MSAAVCIALALGLLDRVCKHRARRGLRRRGRFFELTHLENRGAAAAQEGMVAVQIVAAIAVGAAVTSVLFRALAEKNKKLL